MSDKVVECDCDDWKRGMPEIEAAQFLATNHGSPYTGEVFRFCPWCGRRLNAAQQRREWWR